MRTVLALTVGLMSGFAVRAQEGQFGPGPGRGRFPGANAAFAALDRNGDGILDAAEIQAAPKALAKLDKNQDGQITSDEVRESMPPGRGPRGPGREKEPGNDGAASLVEDTVKTLMAFDKNGDGKLAKEELPDRFQGVFNRGDENKDGFLSPDEIRKMAAAQSAPAEPARSGERGGPEGGRRESPRGEMNLIRVDPILASVDTNGDGILSAEEIRNSANAIKKLVKNGDGSITREEVMPFPGPRRQL